MTHVSRSDINVLKVNDQSVLVELLKKGTRISSGIEHVIGRVDLAIYGQIKYKMRSSMQLKRDGNLQRH